MTVAEFLKWNDSSRGVNVKLAYFDIVGGDVYAAILLAQIIYWFLPSKKTGKHKLRVFREGRWWIAKSKAQWFDETRLTRHQINGAIKLLGELGLIETQTRQYKRLRTLHIALNIEVLYRQLEVVLSAD